MNYDYNYMIIFRFMIRQENVVVGKRKKGCVCLSNSFRY